MAATTFSSGAIRQHAGNAIANGLAWDEALRAVTLTPAEIFGVADSMGSPPTRTSGRRRRVGRRSLRVRDPRRARLRTGTGIDRAVARTDAHGSLQTTTTVTDVVESGCRLVYPTNAAIPVARSYIAPTILIEPFFSRSARIGLRRRMVSRPPRTFWRATAST